MSDRAAAFGEDAGFGSGDGLDLHGHVMRIGVDHAGVIERHGNVATPEDQVAALVEGADGFKAIWKG